MPRPSSPSRSLLIVAAIALGPLVGTPTSGVAQTAAPPAASSTERIDPVDAAVAEASRRFGVPERWIRAVMQQESAGDVDAVSRAGAMGLMQVMPGTYAELRARYGFGPDPFAVRDNVLAGTAYLREMHDRYGGLGMLAAYNAGPGRWERYRDGGRALSAETIGYLARLGPMLDLGALPTSNMHITTVAPSPFGSPIFVALTTRSDAPQPSAERPDLPTVIAANTTVVPSSGELFVRRQTVDAPSASEFPPAPSPSRSRAPDEPSGASERAASPAADSLFPARSQDRRR